MLVCVDLQGIYLLYQEYNIRSCCPLSLLSLLTPSPLSSLLLKLRRYYIVSPLHSTIHQPFELTLSPKSAHFFQPPPVSLLSLVVSLLPQLSLLLLHDLLKRKREFSHYYYISPTHRAQSIAATYTDYLPSTKRRTFHTRQPTTFVLPSHHPSPPAHAAWQSYRKLSSADGKSKRRLQTANCSSSSMTECCASTRGSSTTQVVTSRCFTWSGAMQQTKSTGADVARAIELVATGPIASRANCLM